VVGGGSSGDKTTINHMTAAQWQAATVVGGSGIINKQQ
jgi:hypothetical protein